MTAVKKTEIEKRSCQRCTYEAPIRMTLFNAGHWRAAQTLNCCLEGMCVKSNARFKPGTAILIRVEYGTSDSSCRISSGGIPTMTLGEVKWCREINEAKFSAYELGVKYYTPYY